jgi:cytochrome oxidase Cu insertion factor (SCO1/SenC/PrrC family)
MKNIVILFFSLLFTGAAFSQGKDTLAPYQQFPTIPPFKIQLMDSTTWITKADLQKKPTWIIYFSPDCGHCQTETEEIISNIKQLEKVQIVMVASRPYTDVKNFYDHYLLRRFPNITMGIDPVRLLVNFYKVDYTPFSALYDKKGRLIKAFKDAPKIEEIVRLAK